MNPAPWQQATPGAPIALVVCDMDGTLLDDEKRIPEQFWPLLAELGRRQITFVPASGRQLDSLQHLFAPAGPLQAAIAENGTVVFHDGRVVASDTLSPSTVTRVLDLVEAAPNREQLGVVCCGEHTAWVSRTDEPFVAVAANYYTSLGHVADLHSVTEPLVKLAIYDFGDAESTGRYLHQAIGQDHQVVVSGQHWVDVMNQGVDKGVGLVALQQAMGVGAEQTVVFGDYLNDLQLFDHAGLSFAMANAHQQIIDRATHLAPANTEHGVVQVLRHLLGEHDRHD